MGGPPPRLPGRAAGRRLGAGAQIGDAYIEVLVDRLNRQLGGQLILRLDSPSGVRYILRAPEPYLVPPERALVAAQTRALPPVRPTPLVPGGQQPAGGSPERPSGALPGDVPADPRPVDGRAAGLQRGGSPPWLRRRPTARAVCLAAPGVRDPPGDPQQGSTK